MGVRFRESEDVGACACTCRSALRVWGKARASGDPFIVCTSGVEVQPSDGCHSIPHSQEGRRL